MHSAVAVANNFIARAQQQRHYELNPVKLHELVYIAHGWYLAQTGHPLLERPVAATRDGVLVPELRERGCWGTRRITEQISVFDPSKTASGMMRTRVPEIAKGDPALRTLALVWAIYGALTPYDLANITRQQGGPWSRVWNHPTRTLDEPYDIPDPLLQKWFAMEVKTHMQKATSGPIGGSTPAAA